MIAITTHILSTHVLYRDPPSQSRISNKSTTLNHQQEQKGYNPKNRKKIP